LLASKDYPETILKHEYWCQLTSGIKINFFVNHKFTLLHNFTIKNNQMKGKFMKHIVVSLLLLSKENTFDLVIVV